MITKKEKIYRYNKKDNSLLEIDDVVLVEAKVGLIVNSTLISTLICTERNMEELAIGYLFGKDYIIDGNDIESLRIFKNEIVIKLKEKSSDNSSEESKKKVNGKSSIEPADSRKNNKFNSSLENKGKNLDYSKIFDIVEEFSEQSKLFQETGGVHSAKLVDKDFNDMFFAEDMGRHNAIDKVIGYGLKENISFEDKLIIVSSRMPLELVEKCHKAGITNIAAVSVVTENAARYGRKNNMNIVGMFRKSRFNVYSKKI